MGKSFRFIVLFTQSTSLTGVEFTAETVFDEMGETLAKACGVAAAGDDTVLRDALEDVVDEGVLEKQARFKLWDAALAHIEKGGFIELSDGAAVVALDVVGVNLEHRLGESTGVCANAEVGEGLL